MVVSVVQCPVVPSAESRAGRRRVQATIDVLGEQLRSHSVIAPHAQPGTYRIQLDGYRVTYTINDGRLVIISSPFG